jgi:magnesium and cobalt transporter
LDGSNRAEVLARALEERLSWLPVVDGAPDEIRGSVRVRDLLVHPDRTLRALTMPVLFVPEVASCMDLLRLFRDRKATEAVCVDEWGGTAGYVTVEDVFEELVGELRVEGEAREVEVVPLGEGAYRVPGSLSIRDWNDRFGMRVVPTEFETVGGLVTALLGRIPRSGDEVAYGHLELEVGEVRGRRVDWVRLRVRDGSGSDTNARDAASRGMLR